MQARHHDQIGGARLAERLAVRFGKRLLLAEQDCTHDARCLAVERLREYMPHELPNKNGGAIQCRMLAAGLFRRMVPILIGIEEHTPAHRLAVFRALRLDSHPDVVERFKIITAERREADRNMRVFPIDLFRLEDEGGGSVLEADAVVDIALDRQLPVGIGVDHRRDSKIPIKKYSEYGRQNRQRDRDHRPLKARSADDPPHDQRYDRRRCRAYRQDQHQSERVKMENDRKRGEVGHPYHTQRSFHAVHPISALSLIPIFYHIPAKRSSIRTHYSTHFSGIRVLQSYPSVAIINRKGEAR